MSPKLIALLVGFVSISGWANDLACRCNDRSTATVHELLFHFASEKTASVTLTVAKGGENPSSVCRQDQDFTVSKSDDEYVFNGMLKCADQEPKKMTINFDSSSMTLPNDLCHSGSVFYCAWNM